MIADVITSGRIASVDAISDGSQLVFSDWPGRQQSECCAFLERFSGLTD